MKDDVKGRGGSRAAPHRPAQAASGISTRKRTRSVDSRTGVARPGSDDGSRVGHDAVARRAYDLYLARGAAPGRDLDDWIQAERELCFPAAQT